MSKSSSKRPCPPAILRAYALTRVRQKAWREKPEVMENIRRNATRQASLNAAKRTQRLKGYLAELPDRMTKQELRTLIVQDFCSQKKVSEQAFWQQVRTHGLLAYDPATGLWLNLTRNPQA